MMSNESTHTSATDSTGRRRGLTIGLAGGLLAGTAAGLVFGVPGLSSAASGTTSVAPAALVQQADESDPAATPPADAPEMGDGLREALQPLVDDETLTAEQADAVVAQLIENRPERGDGGFRDGPGGRHPGMMGHGAGVASEALTDLLGIDAAELRTQLRDGATLAEIAQAQGIEPQAVIDELVGELQERVDNAVENGRLDQAEADEKLADAEARITDRVNNGRPERADASTDTVD